MSGIRSLGYLRIESADVAAWREFGVRVLGMAEGRGPEPDALYLRMDDFPARLVVVPGEQERLAATGWEVADEAALTDTEKALTAAGAEVTAGTPEECAARQVAQLRFASDPSGNALEIFCGATLANRPFVSAYGTRFVTGEMGLGHAVLPVTDDAAAMAFWSGVLGFRLRDSMRHGARAVRPAAGRSAVHAVPRLQPAAPLAGAGAVPGRARDRAPDDRGRHAGRRGPGAGPVRAAGRPGQRHPRPARQRPDGVVLRPDAGRVRHRVRHRRPAGRRPDLGEPGRPPRSACGATGSRRPAATEPGQWTR